MRWKGLSCSTKTRKPLYWMGTRLWQGLTLSSNGKGNLLIQRMFQKKTKPRGRRETRDLVRLHRRRRNKRDADIREWDTAQPKRHGVSKGGIAGKRNDSVVGEVSSTDRVHLVLLLVTLDGSPGESTWCAPSVCRS